MRLDPDPPWPKGDGGHWWSVLGVVIVLLILFGIEAARVAYYDGDVSCVFANCVKAEHIKP